MRRYLIFGLALILIMGTLIAPRILRGKEGTIKFKEIQEEDIPEKIVEMLPKYIMEERALTCKYRDEIYVIVTRGEKKSHGFEVDIEKIVEERHSKDEYDIIVHAKFKDPNPDEVLPQEYDYPFTIVKTNLKSMLKQVHLEIEYLDQEEKKS
jgi:hypothetical protein